MKSDVIWYKKNSLHAFLDQTVLFMNWTEDHNFYEEDKKI